MNAETWRGPWKCEKCGLGYPNATSNVNKGKCQLHCMGTLVPFDRRSPEPERRAFVEGARWREISDGRFIEDVIKARYPGHEEA